MRPPTSHGLIGRGIVVAGTPAIAAPGASYAVDFSRRLKNAELLPPAAADSPTGKIDENREEESSELRRQAVHGSGAAPGLLFYGGASVSINETILASGFGVELVQPVDIYRRCTRALKYGGLFIALSFLTLFLVETLLCRPACPLWHCQRSEARWAAAPAEPLRPRQRDRCARISSSPLPLRRPRAGAQYPAARSCSVWLSVRLWPLLAFPITLESRSAR